MTDTWRKLPAALPDIRGAADRLPAVADLTPAEARTLLARAFVGDPLMVWFFPDDEVRPHACAAMFGLFAEQYLAAGRVDVVRLGEPAAVAMWLYARRRAKLRGNLC